MIVSESYVWDESSSFGKTYVRQMQGSPTEGSAICYLFDTQAQAEARVNELIASSFRKYLEAES